MPNSKIADMAPHMLCSPRPVTDGIVDILLQPMGRRMMHAWDSDNFAGFQWPHPHHYKKPCLRSDHSEESKCNQTAKAKLNLLYWIWSHSKSTFLISKLRFLTRFLPANVLEWIDSFNFTAWLEYRPYQGRYEKMARNKSKMESSGCINGECVGESGC